MEVSFCAWVQLVNTKQTEKKKLIIRKYLIRNFSIPTAFGLGALIYIGLEFGSFFETPFESECHQILRGVNPLLQMIFTFMQMYFIFMNSRVSCLLNFSSNLHLIH